VILLDLGISSYQLDTPERGFTFMSDAPLDMRMSPNNPINAATVVNDYPELELMRIFRSYGEERFAKRIARGIISARVKKEIKTTSQLVDIIKKAAPSGWQRIHPATRVFQALRIEVNRELSNLEKFLAGFPTWLNPGGRAGIISFHSLEDRLVKKSFRKYKEEGMLEIVTKKPVTPTAEEENKNPRSRSAKFRVALKRQGV
jgi:16S rRNA (cytosine1402-N4)-methyltransferase